MKIFVQLRFFLLIPRLSLHINGSIFVVCLCTFAHTKYLFSFVVIVTTFTNIKNWTLFSLLCNRLGVCSRFFFLWMGMDSTNRINCSITFSMANIKLEPSVSLLVDFSTRALFLVRQRMRWTRNHAINGKQTHHDTVYFLFLRPFRETKK